MNDALLTTHSRSIDPTPRDRITAIANAMQRRPIVIVLGAPGSGTSLCAHILSALGVDMVGAEGEGGAGPWERAELVALHDRILALFNRAHLGPFHDFALPVAWWADPPVAGIKREIVACLEERMGAGYFGFKDPRAVRLLPMWQQVASELELAPRLVLCLRNPAQIAALSSARDGLDRAIGEYRWLANTVDFFRHANSFDICTVEYESWFEDPSANVTTLKEFLGLEWQQNEGEVSLLVSGIVDAAAAQADQAGRREPSQPLVRSLYKLARRACGDGGARDQIANIALQFVGFQQLQRPFQLAFEGIAVERDGLVEAQRAQLDELAREREARIAIEGEVSGLKPTLAEREAMLAELSRNVDNLTASLQLAQAEHAAQQEAVQQVEQAAQQQASSAEAMQGEIASLRDTVASTEQLVRVQTAAAEAKEADLARLREALAQAERVAEERAAAAEVVQVGIGLLRNTVAATEQQVQQRAAAAEAMGAELAALREALAGAERAAQERGAAADAIQDEIAVLREALVRSELLSSDRAMASALIQSEISALRKKLALAEHERDEHAVARKAFQRELTALRQALTQAEREARQTADGTRTMQAEIEELQDKLIAARQVGKVAMAALQISGEELPQPDQQPRRWRQVLRRIFGAVKHDPSRRGI
jgi:hypothetical protein